MPQPVYMNTHLYSYGVLDTNIMHVLVRVIGRVQTYRYRLRPMLYRINI